MNNNLKLLQPLFKLQWLFFILIVLSAVTLFSSLGAWQVRRHFQRADYNTVIESRLVATPITFDELKANFVMDEEIGAEDSAAYRAVTISGHYDSSQELLVRNREYSGRPGYHVVTPLVFEENKAILVDRGWVATELEQVGQLSIADAPEGVVEVQGMLLPEHDPPTGRVGAKDPAEGILEKVFWVDVERLSQQIPYDLEPAYIRLKGQTPAQATEYPVPAPIPALSIGPHRDYALQWFAFALVTICGCFALLYQTVKKAREKDTTNG